MKLAVVMLAALFAAEAAVAAGSTYVRPHVRKDGTFVQGHMRSAPNQNRYDNYGARNSVYGANPYTGQRGSQRDEFSNPPAYNKPRRNCSGPYRLSSC